ncbi:MAG: phosphatidylglycerophosphatase A [Firmicutes bacterium]|nr:phosphatidylglycerophosphatase A [Bacillota bacterium]
MAVEAHDVEGRDLREHVIALLEERGVRLRDIAEIVYAIQKDYQPGLTLDGCLDSVYEVLRKREVQYALLTGIALDQLAERGQVPEPLGSILIADSPLYGIDEVLALAITNVYGSIGFTNFGYLDKRKIGILAELHNLGGAGGRVNTFLDDLVAGVAAAAASRLAHHWHHAE